MEIAKNKRKEIDIKKLLLKKYEVFEIEGIKYDFHVTFYGPKDSPYEGGKWKVHVLLPDQYPYKSPSIGFINKMFHPNVDEASGTVCLDVINQTWSPLFDLVNIFEIFLPQLLLYPNPTDPLNGEAAKLLMKNPVKYQEKVKEYVELYAWSDKEQEVSFKNDNQQPKNNEEDVDACSELSKASLSKEGEEQDELDE